MKREVALPAELAQQASEDEARAVRYGMRLVVRRICAYAAPVEVHLASVAVPGRRNGHPTIVYAHPTWREVVAPPEVLR